MHNISADVAVEETWHALYKSIDALDADSIAFDNFGTSLFRRPSRQRQFPRNRSQQRL